MYDWIAKWLGKFLKHKLDLQEGTPMENSKPWYKSLTIWSDLAGLVIAGIALADKDFGTHVAASHYYQVVLAILSGLGIYGRTYADSTIQ